MAIGDLYDANNTVVGQAAVFVAAQNTALPAFGVAANPAFNTADPFDPSYFLKFLLTITGATSVTLTYVRDGVTGTTGALTVSGLTAAQIRTALEGLANVGTGNVTITGSASPWGITFKGPAIGGVLTVTPTGGTASIASPAWTPVGGTEQGWQLGASKSTQTINIEEQSTPVGTTLQSQAITLQGNLSDDITRTLTLAMNATAAATAAVSGIPGYDTVTLTDIPIYYAVAAVTTNAKGFGRIIYAPKWTSLGNVSANFRRAAGQRLYGVNFTTVCNTNLIQIYNFNQAALP